VCRCGCGCQAYRAKTQQLRDIEKEVIREAVVAAECDVFLDEATALERQGS
jgi:hypothetical protein